MCDSVTREFTHSYIVDSVEGHWNSAREEFPNLGYKIRPKEGYFPVSPMDTLQDIRNEMCSGAGESGRSRSTNNITKWPPPARPRSMSASRRSKQMGDSMQYYKYIIRNVAKKAQQDRHVHAEAALRR